MKSRLLSFNLSKISCLLLSAKANSLFEIFGTGKKTKQSFVCRLKATVYFFPVLIILLITLLLPLVNASIKTNKNTYNTGEIIYATSTVGISDYLCRSQTPPETVTLYIVENKDSWKEGDSFQEVTSSDVPNSRFPSVKIWENPQAGNYDPVSYTHLTLPTTPYV